MKGKRFLSISIAAACLLMSIPAPAFAVENAPAEQDNAVSVSTAVDTRAAEPAVPAAPRAAVRPAAVEKTTAEPYTLTLDDVQVIRCREDDSTSDSPYIDALAIWGLKDGVDFSDAKYKNIVIPETLPYDVPELDEEGNAKLDENGNAIIKTVEMPVIKFGIDLNQAQRDNIEKLTVSKNLVAFTHDLADCTNLTEVVIPEDAALESFYSGGYSKGMFYNTALTGIFIPAGVKTLPDGIFCNCYQFTSITFSPDSQLEQIGARAFAATAIKTLDIPDTVTAIGENAFGMNTDNGNFCQLEEIKLPDGLTEIPDCLFRGCVNLTKVTFGSNVTSIGADAFKGTALTEIVIPDSVTALGNYGVFADIPTLTSVTIGGGIKTLPSGIFAQSNNISVLNLSEGLEIIGAGAFRGQKIKTVTIPSTVRMIYGSAFGDCAELEEVIFAEGSQLEQIGSDNLASDTPFGWTDHIGGAFQNCISLKELKLPVSKTPFVIGDVSFENCQSLRSVDLGNCKTVGTQVHDIYENHTGGRAFFGCPKLASIKFGDSLEQICKDSFGSCIALLGPLEFPDTLRIIGDGAFNGCSAVEDVTFNEGLEEIGGTAFIGCDLHEIILPDTVTEVGDRCFEGNLHVERVKFSSAMTVIPDRFLDCYAQDVAAYSVGKGSHTYVGQHGMIKELIIPDNIREIGIDAFDCALDLEYLDLGKVEYIGTGAFSIHYMLLDELEMEHGALKTVVMSPCLKEIGTVPPHSVDFEASAYAGVFDGQGDFEGLVLPATLEKVGAYALNGCPAVKEFTMTENLTFVGSHAFDNCSNLSEVTFADTAKTKFEDYAFANTAVKQVVIPAWLDTVPVRICNGCHNLTSVTFSEGIVEISSGAFADTSLTSVALPESCLYVGDSVFQNTPVTSIQFGSNLQSIGANVFVKDTHNDLMQSVVIPESVKSIGEGAFGYYKDSDMGYAELCKEAERLGVPVQSLMGPTVANHDFTLYGGTAAKRYAEENDMIYGGTGEDAKTTTAVTTTTTETGTTTETTATSVSSDTTLPASGSTDTTTQTTATSSVSSDTTTQTTASSEAETTTTASAVPTVRVSPYEMSNWAENDYYKKTGVAPYTSTYAENDDGTMTITLLDKDGNVLEKYTVHPKTGVGFSSSGEIVNLPQTGVNTVSYLLLAIAAFLLLGLGGIAVRASGKRKEDQA